MKLSDLIQKLGGKRVKPYGLELYSPNPLLLEPSKPSYEPSPEELGRVKLQYAALDQAYRSAEYRMDPTKMEINVNKAKIDQLPTPCSLDDMLRACPDLAHQIHQLDIKALEAIVKTYRKEGWDPSQFENELMKIQEMDKTVMRKLQAEEAAAAKTEHLAVGSPPKTTPKAEADQPKAAQKPPPIPPRPEGWKSKKP